MKRLDCGIEGKAGLSESSKGHGLCQSYQFSLQPPRSLEPDLLCCYNQTMHKAGMYVILTITLTRSIIKRTTGYGTTNVLKNTFNVQI